MEFDKTSINIEKYIQGELSGEALKKFEAQIEKDEALQKEVNFYQYSDTVLQDNLSRKKDTTNADAEFKSNLEELGNTYFPNESVNETKPKRETVQEEAIEKPAIIKRLLPFATLAVAAALLLFFFLPNKNNTLYANYFVPEKPISIQSTSKNLTDFENGMSNYKDKNYNEATVLFDKIPNKDTKYANVLLYKGCALMELNQFDKAINTFQQLVTQYIDFSDKANWYLALCYLKKGEEAQVKTILNRISTDDKEYYDNAQKLLQDF